MVESRIEKNQERTEDIIEEERKKKNKKLLKIMFWIFVPLFIIFSVFYFLLTYVGNKGIIVREYAIEDEKLPVIFNGLKIVQFSDVHYNVYSSLSKLEKIVEMINNTNPDIVVFTGDLVDNDYSITIEDEEKLMNIFKKINSTIGKYAIYGEEDSEIFKEIFNNSDFIILDNEVVKIYKDNSSVDLIAFNSNSINFELENRNPENYAISLVHKPDYSDEIIERFNPNIILSGHSHNGQVILPFIGPLMKKEGSKKYILNSYKIKDTYLYISGGIGNTKYNFRLFNNPSINFYRLRTINMSY